MSYSKICLETLNQITIRNIVQNTYTFYIFLKAHNHNYDYIHRVYIYNIYIMHALRA